MRSLEKALITLQTAESSERNTLIPLGAASSVITTILYLATMLSLPVSSLSQLIWFALYPIVGSVFYDVSYSGIFRKSLYVLPLIIFIGIFNPFIDKDIAFYAYGYGVSRGWVSFLSLTIRGLLSVQAVVLLISSYGFIGLCRGLERLYVPGILCTQLLFIYRYLTVLLSEALNMRRAREARGYGKKSFSLRMWGSFIGQLFLRTISRSERIHAAMLSRGFTGKIPSLNNERHFPGWSAIIWITIWTVIFIILRLYNLSALFSFIK